MPPLFTGHGPRVFNIPAGVPFLDALVAELDRFAAGDPLVLPTIRILLPTRRACRALAEALLRARPAAPRLLPLLSPLGDVEDDAVDDPADDDSGADEPPIPPAVGGLERQLALAGLIQAQARVPSRAEAVRLAGELARLIDRIATERLDAVDLERLVPAGLADHWQITLDVLRPIMRRWASMQAETGRLDPAEWRNQRMAALTDTWRRQPPATPVIAAGTTGTIPATADLLAVVARLPQGAVILPGLDGDADDAIWAAAGPSHADFNMIQLLTRLGVDRRQVRPWPQATADANIAVRSAWVREAMRPATAIGVAEAQPRTVSPRAWEAVVRVEAANLDEEARVAALAMRDALKGGAPTRVALVTADRRLARRVAADLLRFGVDVDDSAGTDLGATAPGAFLRLVAGMVTSRFAPVPVLAVLKHPLCALGRTLARCRDEARALERAALRGPRPAPGLDGLRAAVAGKSGAVRRFVDDLATAIEPLEVLFRATAVDGGELLLAHAAVAERLATDDGPDGRDRLWSGEAGEAAAAFMANVRGAAEPLGPLDPAEYADVFDVLMEGQVVRRRHGLHPRAFIWGTLEARLQSADVVILGGLNEDSWPPVTAASPWMSRPMMAAFGLPPPERRIGLAAHDFAQGMGAPRVFLTRSRRVGGVPTVASRWLIRLEALAKAAGSEDAFAPDPLWPARAAALDWAPLCLMPAPEPRPPVERRPRELPVTAIETWMRDPYGIYARRILDLSKLAPVDEEPGGREFGILVHGVLERVFKDIPAGWPDDALARLLAAGEDAFNTTPLPAGGRTFWWLRFERLAAWVDTQERQAAGNVRCRHSEVEGAATLDGAAGTFTVRAKADRIDQCADGGLAIFDFKTGAVPKDKELRAGYAPQLPLEAAIAKRGGFGADFGVAVERLVFWRLSGTGDGGELKPVKEAIERAGEAWEGLARLVWRFDDPETPYLCRPSPSFAPRFSDYEHLARVAEWSVAGDDEEGEA